MDIGHRFNTGTGSTRQNPKKLATGACQTIFLIVIIIYLNMSKISIFKLLL